MSERRAGTKGRRLGSSRRKQLQEGLGQAPAPAPGPSEEPPWASEIVQRVRHLLSARDTEQAGVVTRSDMQKLQEEGLPCSREELELVFDGLDAAGTGRLGTEEFTAGLRQFLSSQNAAREHRRRKTASRRVRLVLPGPALPGGHSEESRHFAALMEQLGTDNPSEEQEIWQLWLKLRQDEPQLLDNLEGFLAKMRQRIQEARREKEALELTLNKRVAEHDKDVQQLCEALEQQIQQEQLRLQQQSMARSQQQDEELQRVLEASEREVQRLVTAQMELERRCRSLQSSQQVTSTENQQLQESNRALQQHLQHLHQQLQHTQGHLRTMRATVAWEHMGEPGDRVVAELPIEVPMSPQLSPGKSEKFRSEMRIRLGSQSSESKAKSTHQVVWEMLPAEANLSGAPWKASSAEEDPFPEPLKEEGVSDQSSLLREMNDAIAALSKHLKAQALDASPVLADTACHPWDNAEPQTGPEAATAHETTPGVLQETLPGHIHHELLEGDLQEGPGTAELRAPDVTQAGGSAGAGHCTAQEPGAEQGESPEQAQRMLFQQGKGAGVEEMVLKVAEHLGDSMEAGEQVLMEVEGAGWLQGTTAWAKPQLLGEDEEVEISQREDLEAGLGPPEAGQEGVAVGQCLAMDEQQPGRTLGVQAPGTELQERADPASGLPGKLETELGEHLEPQPPSWGEAQVGEAHGGGVPEVAVAPGPAVLDEECARTEVQPQGETTDSKVLEVLPARAERAGSSRAGGEEEEEKEAEPREAEQQLQGECARGGAGWRGSMGSLEPLAAAVPPTHGQRGGGTDVELMEAPSSTNMELLAEVEADLQVWIEAGSPGTQQGGGVDPGVQLEKDKPEVGLGEEMGAAAVHSEGPSPAETPVGSPDVCGLFPGMSQALVEADLQLSVDLSPENPQGGKGERAVQLPENEEEDGAKGQVEQGLPHEPVPHPSAVTLGQGEGAAAGLELTENAEGLDTTEEHSSGASVQLIAEGDELRLSPGGSTEADLQLVGKPGSSGTEQGGSVDPDVQHLDQGDKAELVEGEAEDAQADLQLAEGLSSGVPRGGEIGTNVKIEEKDDEAQGQGEDGLSHEPELDLHGSRVEHGEGAGEDMQAQEKAESLDTIEDQSTGVNVQLIAEGDELKSASGKSTEADLQPLSQTDSIGTEPGGNVAPDVQPLDQGDKAEVVERETEDSWTDTQLCVTASPETPQGGEHCAAVQPRDGAGDGGQGQGGSGQMQELVPDPSGVTIRQRRGTEAGVQPVEEAESLDTVENQSTGANVQLIAEGDEFRLSPAGSTNADLQPLGEAGSSGTEQGGSVDSEVQHLDQEDKEEFLERKAEHAQEDMVFHEGPSPGAPWGREGERAVQLEQEEDGAQGQGENELPQEAELDLQGSGVRQGGGADVDMQAQEEAESLDTTEEQSSGASVQLIAEGDELRLSPAGSTEADLQLMGEAGSSGTEQGGRLDLEVQHLDQAHKEDILEMEVEDVQENMMEVLAEVEADLQVWNEAGSSGTEQGGSVDPEVHPLDQGDTAELVEGEAEDAQADLQLAEGLSSGAPWGGEWGRALQNEEDEEGGAEVPGENGLPQESVLAPEGAGGRQGEGAGAGAQPQAEAERLHTLEAQSTDAAVQLFTDQQMPQSGSGGSTEADMTPLGVAGLWEGEQGLTPGLEAVLGASPTANPWEGAAAADVPPPIEAAFCPEPATASEGPGLEAKLGACIGPEGQILEAQELLQGERPPAEGKPLDGAHGLEVAQGERLEAGVRNEVKTQGQGLNQGHDDAELASLVSEVLSQLSPQKLETMMQEDVLIPDVWRLCAPGQAAQRELQEQVSAQGHEGRLHTVAQRWPEGETPPTREPEHTAAGPAEHPKQEVPPASPLHTAVQPGDAGSDQLGVVLRENSLGQRQLLGEQSKGISVGQREKMQEFGQKMSQEGEPSSGEPGAVTAGGAGAAPQGCPKAALDPDHLYNVLFVGDSHVGKTSFLYRLHADSFNPHLTATVGLDYQIKTLVVDNKCFALRLWDSAGQERYRSMTKQFFRKADGVVLMYDITSEYSFSDVRYWLSCIQEGAEDGVAVLLLGNKTDCAAQRQVPTKEGECLAKEHQLMFYECSAASGHNVFESMVSFTRLLKDREDELKNKAEEVPKAPQKKKGCCW
ncbi:ras-related protein Rab-44 isoform X1 [Serinus canaria]|uniref:ras-related protein Rab-44 isoform X1 n=1 Tax=Serinus canaria TaxID=9135 RepID=UPI0021CC63F8|nr:ras-related protein Rab-44 isoform X1 [Serinus canaria]